MMENNSDYEMLMDVIRRRRSVRRFLTREVPETIIEQVLEAARWAPSAGNRQAFRFIVVTSRDAIEAMARAVRDAAGALKQGAREDRVGELEAYLRNFEHFAGAPTVIVPIHREGPDLLRSGAADAAAGPRVESIASVSAAVMNLLLAAHTLGLGACWMTGPLIAARPIEELLGVPRGWAVAALVPVGYHEHAPAVPARRPLSRLIRSVR